MNVIYFYQIVHPKLAKPYTMSLIGPTVSSFAYRDPVAPNRTPNQYSEDYSCLYMPIFELAHMKNVHLFEGLGEFCLFEQSKKISNDQELIQSDPISCPQIQKGNN